MIAYGDEVMAWDNGCKRKVKTIFIMKVRDKYNCGGELFDNVEEITKGEENERVL